MIALSWNCRGLGNRRAVEELGDIIQAQDPKIVFLSETWSTKDQMEHIGDKLDFEGYFTVPSDGRGDGLALLGKASEKVWLDSFSKYHIDVIVHGGSEDA